MNIMSCHPHDTHALAAHVPRSPKLLLLPAKGRREKPGSARGRGAPDGSKPTRRIWDMHGNRMGVCCCPCLEELMHGPSPPCQPFGKAVARVAAGH